MGQIHGRAGRPASRPRRGHAAVGPPRALLRTRRGRRGQLEQVPGGAARAVGQPRGRTRGRRS
eukprot:1654812-Lingulodinium_polyedra.AAC.1